MDVHGVRRVLRGLVSPTTTNTIHHGHLLVKRCASAKIPCMMDKWVEVGGSGLLGE